MSMRYWFETLTRSLSKEKISIKFNGKFKEWMQSTPNSAACKEQKSRKSNWRKIQKILKSNIQNHLNRQNNLDKRSISHRLDKSPTKNV